MICSIGWHWWSKWGTPEEHIFLRDDGVRHIVRLQRKRCYDCGKAKERRI